MMDWNMLRWQLEMVAAAGLIVWTVAFMIRSLGR